MDDTLVHTLPPNIYRSLSEARQTLSVVSSKSSMTAFQRFLARNIAPFALYYIGKRNIKKWVEITSPSKNLPNFCSCIYLLAFSFLINVIDCCG